MNPAPCSCRVRINFTFEERERLSRKSRFSSPGTPNIYSTPSSSRHWMNRSEALVIRGSSDRLVRDGWDRPRGGAGRPLPLGESQFYRALFRLSSTPCPPCLRVAWEERS